jgi:hypothetical protein
MRPLSSAHARIAAEIYFGGGAPVTNLAAQRSEMERLARKLLSLIPVTDCNRLFDEPDLPPTHSAPRVEDADAIISHIEVNDAHGVGVLLQRLFSGQSNLLSIRSADYFGGYQDFGDVALNISHGHTSRDAVFSKVLASLGECTVRRVLCVPYFPDDVRTAVAVKEIYGAPMCTYLMDDQNVCVPGIPDELMRELLAKSALRLAISPELRIAYEQKYGFPFWLLPPLVTGRLILSRLAPPPLQSPPRQGVLIGNIWGDRWLKLLRETVRHSGITLTWYCNSRFRWITCSTDELSKDSIVTCEPPPDDELVKILRRQWFALVPTGTLTGDDERGFLAQLSLPSRLVYLATTSQVPILVLGSSQTAAAHFVEQFGIGMVVNYDRRLFQEAVASITRPDVNLAFRKRALAIAGKFTADGAADWIWGSLARGSPIDRRYEDLMPERKPSLNHPPTQSAADGS